MTRRIVILTEGHTNPHTAKTASCMLRYRSEEVVALLDGTNQGKTSGDLLGVGQSPVIASLDAAPQANTLLLGIAPPGGKIPATWRPIIKQAITRGMTVWSGLHDFVTDDVEFSELAKAHGATLIDVRKNNEHEIARRRGLHRGAGGPGRDAGGPARAALSATPAPPAGWPGGWPGGCPGPSPRGPAAGAGPQRAALMALMAWMSGLGAPS